jgi:hypothetical protein
MVLLIFPRPLPERHGDSAMRMRFWRESSARWGAWFAFVALQKTGAVVYHGFSVWQILILYKADQKYP